MGRSVSAEAIGLIEPSEVRYIDPSLVISISEQQDDLIERRRADNYLELGSTALKNEVYFEGVQIESLQYAIDEAETNPLARKYAELSAGTDVVERVEKVEYVSDVEMDVNADAEISSAGQPLKVTQLNSWKFASGRWQMGERVEAENHNVFRLHREYRKGSLEDKHFIEVSLAGDNLSKAAMDDEGFFTDTMTLVLRSTTIKDGVIRMESAFVAGVKNPGEERHDFDTIVKLGKLLGVDFEGKTAADILDTPLLISKKLLPGGIVDLVKLFDDCAGGTFFGQDKPRGDYEEVVTRSRQRDLSFKQKATDIVDELIARKAEIVTERDATRLLNKVSGKHMIIAAKTDKSINPRVFGPESEKYVISARRHYDRGNYDLADAATRRAIMYDASRSCPGGVRDYSAPDAYSNFISDSNSPESKEWHGGEIIRNAKCRSCKEVKAEVGVCRICKGCVGKKFSKVA